MHTTDKADGATASNHGEPDGFLSGVSASPLGDNHPPAIGEEQQPGSSSNLQQHGALVIDKSPYSNAIDELARELALLAESNLATEARDIFRGEHGKMVKIKWYPSLTSAADSVIRLYPSECFDELLAAILARDLDGLIVLKHRLFPPALDAFRSAEDHE
jgi:hypothetical protein